MISTKKSPLSNFFFVDLVYSIKKRFLFIFLNLFLVCDCVNVYVGTDTMYVGKKRRQKLPALLNL